jgi:hypothetical protein
LICTLADAKIGEREVVQAMPDREPDLLTSRPGLLLITDKGFAAKPTWPNAASPCHTRTANPRNVAPVKTCSKQSAS